jgi:hypothetical protein
VRELDGAAVDELVVAAPFYDAEAFALAELIRRVGPQRVRILVQPERTPVDPDALDRLASRFPGPSRSSQSADLMTPTSTPS